MENFARSAQPPAALANKSGAAGGETGLRVQNNFFICDFEEDNGSIILARFARCESVSSWLLAEYLIVYIFAIFHGEEKSLQIFAVYAVSITLLLGGLPASSRKEEIAQRVFLQKDIKERKSNVQCSKGGSLLEV